MSSANARLVNVILGAWLFISAFLWVHTRQQFNNTWIIGLAVLGLAIIAYWIGAVRYLNAALAVWLFVSVWVLPTLTPATRWNNLVVGTVIFIFASRPMRPEEAGVRGAKDPPDTHPPRG